MAEGLVAVGLASSVVQFIDFGLKTISRAREIYKSADGVSARVTLLNDLSSESSKAVSALQQSVNAKAPNIGQEDIELRTLARKAADTAGNLDELIAKINAQNAQGRTRAAVMKAAKSWKYEERLETLSKNLKHYRSMLDTRILVELR